MDTRGPARRHPDRRALVGGWAIGTVVGALAWLAVGPATAALAVTACTYDLTTDRVIVVIDPGQVAGLAVETAAADLDAESPAGAILFDDGTGFEDGAASTQCGSASEGNTALVEVLGDDGAEGLTIDGLAGAVFGAGIDWAVDLGPSGPDVVEIRGSDGGDTVVVADDAFSMNGSGGELVGVEVLEVEGNGGDDSIDGSALGPARRLVASGGSGADAVLPGEGDDDVTGGDGADVVDWSGGTTQMVVDMAAGTATGQGDDVFTGFEAAVGSAANDSLSGDDAANDLVGGSGDDVLDGRGGADRLDGGLGTDHCELDAADPSPSSCESGAEPQIAGVSPASGPPDTAVTITGSRLGGATRVLFGTVEASFVQLSDAAISATVPDLGPDDVDVRVETPNGTSVPGPGARFSVQAGPSDPPPGTTGTTGTTTGATGTTTGTTGTSGATGTTGTTTGTTGTTGATGATGTTTGTTGTTGTTSTTGSVPPSTAPGSPPADPPGPPDDPAAGPDPTPPAPEHSWVDSVPTGGDIGWDVRAALAGMAAVALGSLVFLLVPFPSQPFNGALQDAYDRFVARLRRALRLGPSHDRRRRVDVVSYVAAVSLSALLYAWLDPAFGARGHAVVTYLGLLAGLVAVTLTLCAADVVFARVRRHERGVLRGYGWALPVAAACVAVSRLADFQPGYLYGAIAGLVFAAKLDEKEEGRRVAVSAAWIAIVGAVAFVGRTPIHEAASLPGAGAALEVADTALAALLVACMEWLAFGLVPITFLPGRALKAWNPWLWAGFLSLGVFAFVYVLSYGEVDYLSSAPLRTTVVLFAAFGLVSGGLWAYVTTANRRRAGRGSSRTP